MAPYFSPSKLFPVLLLCFCGLLQSAPKVTFTESTSYTGLNCRGLTLIAGTAKSNFVISSLQTEGEIYLSSVKFVCQTKDGSVEFENSLDHPAPQKIFSGKQDGEWRWITTSSWKYLNLKRTIALGDYPGFKITYEYKITRPFNARRLYLSFSMPNRNYENTGYIENGVMQFRPVKKAEWLGIFRDPYFPYITFGGARGSGAMILAGDRSSWNQLPRMLLYSSGKTSYSSTEFMYQQGVQMQPGMTGRYSFYVIPVKGSRMSVEAAEIYSKLQNHIQ